MWDSRWGEIVVGHACWNHFIIQTKTSVQKLTQIKVSQILQQTDFAWDSTIQRIVVYSILNRKREKSMCVSLILLMWNLVWRSQAFYDIDCRINPIGQLTQLKFSQIFEQTDLAWDSTSQIIDIYRNLNQNKKK